MKTYQKFIVKLYLKNFLLLFLALEFFFIGMDLLQNLGSISPSANLKVLYVFNRVLYYVNFTLPLALIFAMFLSIFNIIKSNELISLYALGISKEQVIKPIMLIAVIITLFYIVLNFFPAFVNAYEESKNIKKYGHPDQITSELLLKSKDTYAYIDQLIPEKKVGQDLKVFITNEHRLVEILEAKSAIFKDNHWQLQNVKSTKIPNLEHNISDKKLIIEHYEVKEILHGFTPQIIDTLFKRLSRLTIQDAFSAITLLDEQNLSSDKIRANLYTLTFFPLIAPILIYGLFFPLPAQRRGTNIALLSSLFIFTILIIWGVLFTMTKITENGAITPEYGIIIPIIILALLAWYLSRKYQVKHI
ncbi:MAG: LptF/LptG family permease [Epsilonproteobacteria bacterium]|nr:LptF/LptG family permease [Campylobacterota bacterium]